MPDTELEREIEEERDRQRLQDARLDNGGFFVAGKFVSRQELELQYPPPLDPVSGEPVSETAIEAFGRITFDQLDDSVVLNRASRLRQLHEMVWGTFGSPSNDGMNAKDTARYRPRPPEEGVEEVVDQTLRSLDDFLSECDEICVEVGQ